MTQRTWIVAFTCGLSTGLLTGCTLTRGPKEEIIVSSPGKPPPDSPPDPPPSPYHAADNDKRQQRVGAEKPGEIRPIGYANDGSAADAIPHVPGNPTDPRRHAENSLPPLFPTAGESGKSPPEAPVLDALRYLLDKRLAEAVHALERYDKADQEALLLLLPWVAQFAEGGLNQGKPQEVEKFLEQLEDLSRRLRPRAALTLPRVCFCDVVHGFGMIEPLPANHVFQAGGEGRFGEPTMLYVEVGNTASRPVGQLHETRLAGRLEILDAQGKRVWGDTFPAKPNSSFTPRHDYFIIFYFGVPAQLRPGRYKVRVEVTDQTWHGSSETPPHRTARQDLMIEVAAGEGVRTPTRSAAVMGPAAGGGR